MRIFLSALAILAISAVSVDAQNALKNPGFEDPTFTSGSTIGRWFRFASTPNGASSESTSMSHGGARHITLETLGTNQFAGVMQQLENPALPGTALAVAPGEIVTFSGWHTAVGSSNQTSEVKLEWRGSPNPPQNRSDILNIPVGQYSQFMHTGVAPTGTTGLLVSYAISTFAPGQNSQTLVYIDDFQVTFGGLLGDYNDSGRVDAADYVVWRKHVGTTKPIPNNPNGATIGTAQYNTWRANFANTDGSGAASAAIPEPASIMLVLFTPLVHIAMRIGSRHPGEKRGNSTFHKSGMSRFLTLAVCIRSSYRLQQ